METDKNIITNEPALEQPSEKEIQEFLNVNSTEFLNAGNIEFMTDEEIKKHLDVDINKKDSADESLLPGEWR